MRSKHAIVKHDQIQLDVPTFTDEEIEALREPDQIKRALAITAVMRKVVGQTPSSVSTTKNRATQLRDAFDNAFLLAQGPAKLVIYANEDFKSFISDYAKLATATQNFTQNNNGPVNFNTGVPASTLDDQILDVHPSVDDDMDLGDDSE